MSGPYDNIINLPHPTSKRHPRMSLHDRAAQFSPFAALSGHAAALAESMTNFGFDRALYGFEREGFSAIRDGRPCCWSRSRSSRKSR